LGNPGIIYAGSRHNIGFLVIRHLARIHKIVLKKDSNAFSLTGKGRVGKGNVILAMPLTFMNLSGLAVKALLKKYKVDLNNLLVICDNLDLEFARLKVCAQGSSGGHRGLKSTIDSLGTQDFARLGIGIGRPLNNLDASEYVLSPFTRREKQQISSVIKKASDCCLVWANEGITKSMNIFNRKEIL
jgi:PTH1 family peptidyl-tRNA hydrolase